MQRVSNMKKFISILVCLILTVTLFSSCSVNINTDEPNDKDATKQEIKNPYDMFVFTHYSTGGTEDEQTAVILFEHANTTFTTYQVAYPSCTCRDVGKNYYSVMYIELLNSKDSADDASIRAISFGNGLGLFGDEDNYSDFTLEKMDDSFYQKLVGVTKAEFDKYDYNNQIEGIDAITGATVTMSNTESCIKSLFQYHADKYYADK